VFLIEQSLFLHVRYKKSIYLLSRTVIALFLKAGGIRHETGREVLDGWDAGSLPRFAVSDINFPS
jgi:hypothetical protein